MAVVPSGILSEPLDEFATLISQSATFQSWTGTATPAAAKARIVVRQAVGVPTRPFAAIDIVPGFEVRRGGHASGQMWLYFEATVTAGNSTEPDAYYEFANKVGAVLDEIMTEMENAGRLLIQSRGLAFETPPQRGSREEKGDDYYLCSFRVPWGLK